MMIYLKRFITIFFVLTFMIDIVLMIVKIMLSNYVDFYITSEDILYSSVATIIMSIVFTLFITVLE